MTEPDAGRRPRPRPRRPRPPRTARRRRPLRDADPVGDADTSAADDAADAADRGRRRARRAADGDRGGRRRRRDRRAATPDDGRAPERQRRGPRTVGRFVADALRAAGVRYAFTVPGESFLGLLDALGDAGIRVVATRHEGGGGVHGRGPRPADRPTGRVPRDARGRRREPRDRHPHGAAGLEPDVRDRRPGRARVPRSRGVPGDRPGRHARWPRQVGRRAAPRPRTSRPSMAQAVREALAGRPGPVLLSLPEDLLDEVAELEPADAARPAPRRARRPTRSAPSSSCWPRPERPVILAGGGVLRARTSTELAAVRRAAPRPGHRGVAPRRRHLERPSALSRHGRPRGARVDPRSGSPMPMRSSSSAAG